MPSAGGTFKQLVASLRGRAPIAESRFKQLDKLALFLDDFRIIRANANWRKAFFALGSLLFGETHVQEKTLRIIHSLSLGLLFQNATATRKASFFPLPGRGKKWSGTVTKGRYAWCEWFFETATALTTRYTDKVKEATHSNKSAVSAIGILHTTCALLDTLIAVLGDINARYTSSVEARPTSTDGFASLGLTEAQRAEAKAAEAHRCVCTSSHCNLRALSQIRPLKLPPAPRVRRAIASRLQNTCQHYIDKLLKLPAHAAVKSTILRRLLPRALDIFRWCVLFGGCAPAHVNDRGDNPANNALEGKAIGGSFDGRECTDSF